MGNGTVTSKFRLALQDIGSKLQDEQKEASEPKEAVQGEIIIVDNNKQNVESPETHHPNNCNRCYRLKKKCSREKPSCANCQKTKNECEYVIRTNKRRKKETLVAPLEPKMAQLVSVSSMLINDNTSDFKMREIEKVNKRDKQVSDKVMNQLMKSFDFKHEYITMQLDPSLSRIFVDNYFDNFELSYPFITRIEGESQINSISFHQEVIINLDLFLILSIGCLIYDYNHKTKHFDLIYKEKLSSIIDVFSYNQLNMKNLILLTIYSILVLNEDLTWNLVGLLSRLVIKSDLYKGTQSESQDSSQYTAEKGSQLTTDINSQSTATNSSQSTPDKSPQPTSDASIFWTVYNLDKEYSLLLHKPSQFPPDEIIKTSKIDSGENVEIVNQYIQLYQYYNEILTLNLTGRANRESLIRLSTKVEEWRVETSKLVHHYYVKSKKLQDYINYINLQYYYILIEIDQLSTVESWQFTLQFLSNSFSLILEEDVKNKLSINNLYWYVKFFNVIKYNVKSLLRVFGRGLNKVELSLKLTEFNSNLQLIINLLKYLVTNNDNEGDIGERVKRLMGILVKLDEMLGIFNAITGTEAEKDDLVKRVSDIYKLV